MAGKIGMVTPFGIGAATAQYTRCVHCGRFCRPHDTMCPQCRQPLHTSVSLATRRLDRCPLTVPVRHQGSVHFASDARAMLQFLPSGVCILLPLKTVVIIGRAAGPIRKNILDLSDLNAHWHGVSREHCLLRRESTSLVVVDLNSMNGTYLNGERLMAYQGYVLANGDQVILGTLHLTVFFETPNLA
jgi:hypothetical protein